MTWFGTVSAWAAVALGAMFAVNAYFQFATGAGGWIYSATALGLAFGGFRTLRKMSGGLRLLAGAWGFMAGLLMLPWVTASPSTESPLAIGLVLVALAGLALAVLHKETK